MVSLLVLMEIAAGYLLVGLLFVVWLLVFQTREGEVKKSVDDLGLFRVVVTLMVVVVAWPLFVVLSIGQALEQ